LSDIGVEEGEAAVLVEVLAGSVYRKHLMHSKSQKY
jgi:hypothetical protein